MQEMPGREDTQEEEMATDSSILSMEFSRQEYWSVQTQNTHKADRT